MDIEKFSYFDKTIIVYYVSAFMLSRKIGRNFVACYICYYSHVAICVGSYASQLIYCRRKYTDNIAKDIVQISDKK